MKTAAQTIKDKIAESQRAPSTWLHVATALSGEAGEPVWAFFDNEEPKLWRVVDRVRQAFEQARAEVGRPSKTDERQDIESIILQATNLQKAIKRSSLPCCWVRNFQYELKAKDMPPIPIDLGWHSLPAGGFDIGYPLAICEVLQWASELAQQHLDGLPVRAVARHKDQPEVTAFVRLLAWHFNREFGQEHKTAIAHIATAVYDLADPLDVKSVEGRLKGRSKPFKTT